ncbi:hypothetical protein TNCV_3060481 [Trichonephila clavipes]|uniref:Uncharacterized protein n=1 Tax=Trichonephila clavipes TaxID=2585209 RepID=A0A8X6W0I8_TRICX|nr:hypothetical protein TNCV_3060481 [Trichonephila clavipes]
MHGFIKLFRCSEHLEIATEKKHQPARVMCDGIINFRKQVACVKRKAVATKRLGRSSGVDGAEFCSKSTKVYESCRQ